MATTLHGPVRFLIICTEDLPIARTAADIQRLLASQRYAVDAVQVATASDLSSAVLRGGRARLPYDAAIVLGAVDAALESFVAQSVNNAAVAVFLPVVIALGTGRDANAVVSRALRLVSVGESSAGLLPVTEAPAAPTPVPTYSGASGAGTPVSASGAPFSDAFGASRRGFAGSALAQAGSSSVSAGAWPSSVVAAPAAVASAALPFAAPGGARRSKVSDFAGTFNPVTGEPEVYRGAPTSAMPPVSTSSVSAAPTGVSRRGFALGAPDAPNSGVYGGDNGAAGVYRADDSVKRTLYILREALIKHGGKGIAAVARRFAVSDRDGGRSLDADEFARGLQQIGVSLPLEDVKRLFAYFDHSGSGQVDYDEFLVGLRGELNERRKAMVDTAFKVLDRSGRGYVDMKDIQERFDASRHPDVISGRSRPDKVYRDFLDGFDGGVRDGRVMPIEFERYYAALSSYIDDDDYFELMMRNVWHISGGKGWAENTSNRRVLVTHRDGHQTVEEVPDDLSAGTNVVLIKRALASKGIDAVAVSLYGGADSGTVPWAMDPAAAAGPAYGAPGSSPTSSIAEAAAARRAAAPGGTLYMPDAKMGRTPAGVAPRPAPAKASSAGDHFGTGMGGETALRPGKRSVVFKQGSQFTFG